MDEDSILQSIKKLLGIAADYTAFDVDIMIHINTVFSVLHNIGAAPPEGFSITGPDETWSSFLENHAHVNMVKTYMYLKVKLVFDPPATSFAIAALEKTAAELEWRLNTMELTFNRFAYGEDPAATFVWAIDGGEVFPEEMENGDVGFDPETGDVWRKTGG